MDRSDRHWLWPLFAAGIAFVWLNRANEGPASPLQWLEWPMFAAMAAGLVAGRGLNWRPRRPGLAYVALVWALGMTYELTLTVDGTGLGGVHQVTWASFLFAQGDYLLLALVTLWLIQLWGLDFETAVWLAGGKSLTEGLIFTGVLTAVILSPSWPAAPLMLGYYTIAYAAFLALPLLVIDPAPLWRPGARPPPVALLWIAGLVAALIVRLVWGLGYIPLIEALFPIPPNLMP